ncbi:hypothetical protein GQ53DRAFT_639409 [Thozetella sp. PMI_491]|nr:hypothetical protein GQ53DRAFT_639409 [Thozetella sp. PMI_491]
MLSTASVVAAVLAVAAPVAAQSGLSKPAIKPSFDLDGTMETQLRNTLPTHSFTVTTWAPGFVPQACKTEATSNSVSAADFAVLNVTYSDCADPWVVCRHKDSPVSQTDSLTYFGQIPVGMRQYVRNLIAMPTSSNVAYTVGAYTVVFGDWFHIGTMAHEFTHILDTVALTQYVTTPGSPFSNTARWQSQENKDTALPTGYAASSWQEDFAEAGRVALTDMIVSGGLASINPNSSQIAVQVSTCTSPRAPFCHFRRITGAFELLVLRHAPGSYTNIHSRTVLTPRHG